MVIFLPFKNVLHILKRYQIICSQKNFCWHMEKLCARDLASFGTHSEKVLQPYSSLLLSKVGYDVGVGWTACYTFSNCFKYWLHWTPLINGSRNHTYPERTCLTFSNHSISNAINLYSNLEKYSNLYTGIHI